MGTYVLGWSWCKKLPKDKSYNWKHKPYFGVSTTCAFASVWEIKWIATREWRWLDASWNSEDSECCLPFIFLLHCFAICFLNLFPRSCCSGLILTGLTQLHWIWGSWHTCVCRTFIQTGSNIPHTCVWDHADHMTTLDKFYFRLVPQSWEGYQKSERDTPTLKSTHFDHPDNWMVTNLVVNHNNEEET